MTARDQEEQDWRIEQMKAEVDYKRGLLRWEPWKVAFAAFAAGAAIVGAIVAFEGYFNPRTPTFPPGTVITVPK